MRLSEERVREKNGGNREYAVSPVTEMVGACLLIGGEGAGVGGRLLQVRLQEGTKVRFVGDGVFKAFKKRRLVQRTSTSF